MTDEKQEVVIDEVKLRRMEQRIYYLEHQNMLTNERTAEQMIELIKKTIETEAKKCY